eukprot:1137964-Pelagomonas_calceolata.AAC.1
MPDNSSHAETNIPLVWLKKYACYEELDTIELCWATQAAFRSAYLRVWLDRCALALKSFMPSICVWQLKPHLDQYTSGWKSVLTFKKPGSACTIIHTHLLSSLHSPTFFTLFAFCLLLIAPAPPWVFGMKAHAATSCMPHVSGGRSSKAYHSPISCQRVNQETCLTCKSACGSLRMTPASG